MGDVTDASDVLTVSWTGPEELVLVAESLLSRRIEGWKDALDLIQIWSQRVERMTTGE